MSRFSERHGRPEYLAAIVLGFLLLAAAACTGPTVPQNEPTATTAPAVTATPAPAATALTEAVKVPVAPPSPIPSPTATATAAPPTATAAPPTATAKPTPASAEPPRVQLSNQITHLVVTSTLDHRATLWMVDRSSGKVTPLVSGDIPDQYPYQYAYQHPYGPLRAFAPSDGRFLLARVLEYDPAKQASPAGLEGLWYAGQTVLYAFSPDGTNRRELGRGSQVALLGEEVAGDGSFPAYIPEIAHSMCCAPSTVVDRSLSADGRKLWFAVMTGTPGPEWPYDTITWYTWDVQTGERKEQLVSKMSSATSQYLVATTPGLSKALLVKGTLPHHEPVNSPATVLLLDTATGATRELATVAPPARSFGWTSGPFGSRLSDDGSKALVFGQRTLLIDTASGKSVDLGVANSVGGALTADGTRGLVFAKGSAGVPPGYELFLIDVAQGKAKVVDGRKFEMTRDFWGGSFVTDRFLPGTSLAVVWGGQTDQTWYLVDASSGAVQELTSSACGFEYLPMSGRLAVCLGGGPEGKLLLLDAKQPANRVELDDVQGYAIESPDGKHIAALGTKVVVIDLANPKPVEVAPGDSIASLQFSPDGSRLAYTQGEGTPDEIGRPTGPYSISIVGLDGKELDPAVQGAVLQQWLP